MTINTINHASCSYMYFPVKRNLLGQRRSFWGVIENLEKISGSFMESVQNTKSITGIK